MEDLSQLYLVVLYMLPKDPCYGDKGYKILLFTNLSNNMLSQLYLVLSLSQYIEKEKVPESDDESGKMLLIICKCS